MIMKCYECGGRIVDSWHVYQCIGPPDTRILDEVQQVKLSWIEIICLPFEMIRGIVKVWFKELKE